VELERIPVDLVLVAKFLDFHVRFSVEILELRPPSAR
jgi:hypothetical protein